jgi:hypothetical protein
MLRKSVILSLFSIFVFALFANSAFAAGYSCPTYKKYTLCSNGYYMVAGSNGITGTGNSCNACSSLNSSLTGANGATCTTYNVAGCRVVGISSNSPTTNGTTTPACMCNTAGYHWNGSSCVADGYTITLQKVGSTTATAATTHCAATNAGTTSVSCTCPAGSACTLPSAAVLTGRTGANSTTYSIYGSDGTSRNSSSAGYGRWCTGYNGTGTCYKGNVADGTFTASTTLYADFSCPAGYYKTAASSTECTAVGNGYWSPSYSTANNTYRWGCPSGYANTHTYYYTNSAGTTASAVNACYTDYSTSFDSQCNNNGSYWRKHYASSVSSASYSLSGQTYTWSSGTINQGSYGVVYPYSGYYFTGNYFASDVCAPVGVGYWSPSGESARYNCPSGYTTGRSDYGYMPSDCYIYDATNPDTNDCSSAYKYTYVYGDYPTTGGYDFYYAENDNGWLYYWWDYADYSSYTYNLSSSYQPTFDTYVSISATPKPGKYRYIASATDWCRDVGANYYTYNTYYRHTCPSAYPYTASASAGTAVTDCYKTTTCDDGLGSLKTVIASVSGGSHSSASVATGYLSNYTYTYSWSSQPTITAGATSLNSGNGCEGYCKSGYIGFYENYFCLPACTNTAYDQLNFNGNTFPLLATTGVDAYYTSPLAKLYIGNSSGTVQCMGLMNNTNNNSPSYNTLRIQSSALNSTYGYGGTWWLIK